MMSRVSRSVLRVSCVAFCVAVALPVFAATYYVDAEKGDDGYDGLAPESAFKSFAYAVSQLPNSSTLVFAKGRYEMTNSVEKAIKGCTFRGATGVREDVVLDGCGKYRILRENSVSPASRTTFESLTVVNAYSDHETQKGGALSIASDDLWITNCVFSSCTNLKTGCSVAVAGTEVKVFDSLFTNNAAVAGAELLNANAAGAGGHAVLYRSRFVDNVANGQAIMGQGNGPWGAAYDCTFERNANLLDGGGVFSGHVTMVSNCTFIANSAKGGGGVWGSGNVTESVFSYVDCRFVGNSSAGSGGVFSTSKHLLDLVRCSFTSNTAISGGVVSSSAQLYRVLDCAFTNNFCEVIGGASGGAISASSIGLLSGTTFVSNYIHSTGANPGHNTTAGGAICLTKNSTLSYTVDGKDYDLPHIISNCTFVGNYNVQDKRADNQSTARGGAIAFGSGDTAEGSANPSDYKVVDCRFEGNYLRTDSGYNNLDAGGAIYAVNGLRLYGTAFVGNSTVSGGGAFAGYAPVISNCTFVGNSAVYAVPNLTSKAGTGGAVVLFSEPWDDHTSGVYQVVADCLFASNSIAGTTGSAFVLAQGHMKMSDCTFVGNHAVGNGETYSGSYGGTLALDVGRVPLVGNMNSHWRQGKNTTKDPALSVEYVEIDRCTFSGNVSEGLGGAIYCCDEPAAIPSPSPVVRLRNSLFIDNMATNCPASSGATAAKGRGGALHYQKQQMDIANCTFVRNSAQGLGNNSYGGAINSTGTNTGITNCVFYGNWHDKTSDEGRTVKLPQTVDYDVIAYCYLPDTPSSHFRADPAWHNIISNDDPFRSDDHTDLAVKKGCGSGVGLPLGWMEDATDLGGKPRLAADDTVDFGCYQFWRKPGLLLFVW